MHHLDHHGVGRGGPGPGGELGGVADVVGERLTVDHRVRVVEDHGATALGQLAGEQPLLEALELDGHRQQVVLVEQAAQDREAVLAEEGDAPVHVVGAEHADLDGEAAADHEAPWGRWVRSRVRPPSTLAISHSPATTGS